MKEILDHPWVKVLLIATTVAMCSFALRETASITLPIVNALSDVLVPVAIGFVIAYVLTPVVDLIARRAGFGRTVATAVLFAVTALGALGTLVVVAPLLARQSAELADQVVRGEPFVDRNGNGHYDVGEPFDDLNHNGHHDASVISRFMSWTKDHQTRIKRMANLTVEDEGLALLELYESETQVPRLEIDRLMSGGEPNGAPPVAAPTAWDPAWPGPAADAMAVVIARRPQLAPYLYTLGRTWADAHRRVITAIRTFRGGPEDPDLATLTEHVKAATAVPLKNERRRLALDHLRRLEEADHAGSVAAHELLTELRGGESSPGSQALAMALDKIEGAVRHAVESVPDRIGGWAESVLGSTGTISGWLIDCLLVPIYAFFLILAMPNIRSGITECIPMQYRDQTLRLGHDIERVVSAFFRGRLVICIVCALVGVIGFLALQVFGVKVPYGILFGVLIGLVTPIPLAGIVAAAPAIALTMIQPDATAMHGVAVFCVYLAVQGTEAILIPVILGREVELHPVTLIISLLLCGKLMGVLGLILAVPIAATVRILAREFLWPRLKQWTAKGFEAVQPPKDQSG